MRDPLDIAILSHDHPDVHGIPEGGRSPFDFERRLVSVIVGNGDMTSADNQGSAGKRHRAM